ncbi:MAG: transcriptional regulator, MarR family [Frondihabitans sp.]|nr:transcriptional regulator, MarR family [Frondihabitans sp.]
MPTDPADESHLLELGTQINALLSASRSLTERSAAQFHPDLTPAAFHLARWLFAFGPTKPSVLAAQVSMDRSSTSALIGRMKKLDIVTTQPDPADHRGVIVDLTETGRKHVTAALDLRGAEFADRLAGWDAADVEMLTTLLRRFNHHRTTNGPAHD